MTFHQRRILGWAILFAFAALGGGWLLRLDFAQKISTDVLDLIPGKQRALARTAEDDAVIIELESWPNRPPHREKADERGEDRGPTNASPAEQQHHAANFRERRQRQEQDPWKTSVDDGHVTTRTPPGMISARSTLPR